MPQFESCLHKRLCSTCCCCDLERFEKVWKVNIEIVLASDFELMGETRLYLFCYLSLSRCSGWSQTLNLWLMRRVFYPGNTKRGSITVLLTSCLTGLDQSVLQIITNIVSCLTADSKPVKQEVNGTVILPPLVFPGQNTVLMPLAQTAQFAEWPCRPWLSREI